MYESHANDRDKFEVIAIHDKTVSSFAELDKHLPKLRDHYWQGKDLPFPVLLDATGKTEQLYGIHAHPTGLLIDPSGKLIGEATPAMLEEKLPPLPIAKRWERHRDIQKNVFWSFEPSSCTLAKLADILHIWIGCPVALDEGALKASGLTADGPLPGVVIGVPITVRSLDELLLAPHGLGVAPSPDGKKLLITRRPPEPRGESYLQKLHARELTERLDPAALTSSEKLLEVARRIGFAYGIGRAQNEAKLLEIKNETLLDALKRINHEYDLPIGLDAKAMRAGKVDLHAKVTGQIVPNQIRTALLQMLQPLGLQVEVRDEVVFVTPRDK